ncbi:MAG: Mov34/MPN/PAD-1 family protein [Thermoplasmata archaeon]
MAKMPKILSASSGDIPEKIPPQNLCFTYLPGRKRELKGEYAGYWSMDDVAFYISNDCFARIMNDAVFYGNKHLECLGLIIGKFYEWKGRQYSIGSGIVSSKIDSSQTHVRFDRNSLDDLCKNLGVLGDQLVVGWYHSHPGHGCFMSAIDVSTQKRLFNSSLHSAIVVDPFINTIKVFGIQNNICIEKGFTIYDILKTK